MTRRETCRSRLVRCVLALAVATALSGCSGRPDAVQVSGTVTFKDGSVPQAGVRVVQFVPAQDSPAKIRKAATGEIRDDGTFVAFTRKPGDGVHVGKYDVTFSVWEGVMNSVSLLDGKYSSPTTTPYHVNIEDDVSDLVFEVEPPAKKSGR
ncbi:MAG: hypothetical protein IT424_16275 [Pirellulales bacterium]|nr:hypothetical protein [Pirellulales bacterium]